MNKLVITKVLEQRLRRIKDCSIAEQLLQLPITPDINYLSISKEDNSQISYMDNAKIDRFGLGKKWNVKLRSRARPGRVIQRILPNLQDREVESFVNKYSAAASKSNKSENKISIVFGEKIKFWYHRKNYFSECGDLGCSCMKYDECQDYFGIYTNNPDHVGMAIMVNNENKLLARCLIWYPNTKKDKTTIFFDRIYAYSDQTEFEMYNWCIGKGFTQCSNKNINKPKNVPTIKIHLPNLKFSYYPYVDTFYYLDTDNLNNLAKGISLDSTDGRLSPDTCDLCDEESDELEIIGGGMHSGHQACECCREYSNHHGCYIFNGDATYCNYTRDWYFSEETVELYDGEDCFIGYHKLKESFDGHYFIEGDEHFAQPVGSDIWYSIDDLDLIDDIYYMQGTEEYNLKLELQES